MLRRMINSLARIALLLIICFCSGNAQQNPCTEVANAPQVVFQSPNVCVLNDDVCPLSCPTCGLTINQMTPTPNWDGSFRDKLFSSCTGSDGQFTLHTGINVRAEWCCGFWGGGWWQGYAGNAHNIWIRVDNYNDSFFVNVRHAGTIAAAQEEIYPGSSAGYAATTFATYSVTAQAASSYQSRSFDTTLTYSGRVGNLSSVILDFPRLYHLWQGCLFSVRIL